jgi:hypothetical protein
LSLFRFILRQKWANRLVLPIILFIFVVSAGHPVGDVQDLMTA